MTEHSHPYATCQACHKVKVDKDLYVQDSIQRHNIAMERQQAEDWGWDHSRENYFNNLQSRIALLELKVQALEDKA